MDLLADMSRDELHTLTVVAATVFALVAGTWRPHRIQWTALGAVLLFAALNAVAGIYVLNHYRDPRWAAGSEPPLAVPSFSGTPLVGQYLEPLDTALNSVAGGVNDFVTFKHALPLALDFLTAAGWAVLAALPLAIIAASIHHIAARRQKADFEEYRAAVDLLREDLEHLKQQITSNKPATNARQATAPTPAIPGPPTRPPSVGQPGHAAHTT